MKFDCFHCVVPLLDYGAHDLDFLTATGSCFAGHNYNKDEQYFAFLGHRDAINNFPRQLLDYNLAQVKQLLYRFLHVPIDSQPFCITELILMWPELNSTTRRPTQETGCLKIVIEEPLKGEKVDDLQEKARKASPLCKGATTQLMQDEAKSHDQPTPEPAILILEQMEKIEELKKEKAAAQEEIDELKKEKAAAQEEIDELKKEKAAAQEEIDELKKETAAAQKEIDELKRENERLRKQ